MVALGRWFTHRFFIGSEIFGRLRSSKYTPSVSLSLDSSLREGAGNGYGGLYHSTGYSLKSGVTGDFHRPYGGRVPFIAPPGDSNVAGDFHRPYGTQNGLHFTIQQGVGVAEMGGRW